jgi:hypothetical protein
VREELAGAVERTNPRGQSSKCFAMHALEPRDFIGRYRRAADFAQQLVGEQPAAHADAAMHAPDVELNPAGGECFLPGEHMLVHAVDQRTIEIEEKRWAVVGHV